MYCLYFRQKKIYVNKFIFSDFTRSIIIRDTECEEVSVGSRVMFKTNMS